VNKAHLWTHPDGSTSGETTTQKPPNSRPSHECRCWNDSKAPIEPSVAIEDIDVDVRSWTHRSSLFQIRTIESSKVIEHLMVHVDLTTGNTEDSRGLGIQKVKVDRPNLWNSHAQTFCLKRHSSTRGMSDISAQCALRGSSQACTTRSHKVSSSMLDNKSNSLNFFAIFKVHASSAYLSPRITTVIQVVFSVYRFTVKTSLNWDMHDLIFETSIKTLLRLAK
jgi:hypothetical protein